MDTATRTEMPEITEEVADLLERIADFKERFPAIYGSRVSMLARGEIDEEEFVRRMEVLVNRTAGLQQQESEAPVPQDEGTPKGQENWPSEQEDSSMAQLADRLAALLGEYNQKVEQIRSDERLADSYKQQQLTELYQTYTNRHQEIVQRAQESAQHRLDEAERRVLRPRFPDHLTDAEYETYLMSYRDAVSRVEAALEKARRAGAEMDNPKERLQVRREAEDKALQKLLSQAQASSDETLSQALFHHAARENVHTIREAYLQTSPDQQKDWDRLLKAQKEQQELMSHGTLLARGLSTPQRPQEVNPLTAMGPAEVRVVDPKARAREAASIFTSGA